MTSRHEAEALGAYVLGALDQREREQTTGHLTSCSGCQTELDELIELREMLDEVPPEVFLDGPPDEGELLLHRTLRRVRGARAGSRRTRFTLAAAAAAVLVTAALAGGTMLGRPGGPAVVALPSPTSPTSATGTPVPGARVLSGTENGARLTATVIPAAGWVRVNASAAGIPAGQRCRLVVVSKSGQTEVAGSWQVSPQGAVDGVEVAGSALVAPDQVAAVQVRNLAGQTLVTAST